MSDIKQIIVQANEGGQRLDKLLGKILNKAPKSFIYKMLRKKNIVLNGKKADGSEKVAVDDEIKLFLSDATILEFSEEIQIAHVKKNPISIVYEDQHIMVMNKPLGELSQRAAKDDVSMVDYLISYMLESNQITKEQLQSFKPGICNRLDRNTSGLMVAGKSLLGLQELSRLIKERQVDKYYLCIVKGKVKNKQRIEGYLLKDEVSNKVSIYQQEVKDAEYICTEYVPLKYASSNENAKEGYTLLEVKLITGKSHQIRAHLSSIGHPLLGDFKYGNGRVNQQFKSKYHLDHQLLHSYRLVFPVIEGELSYLSKQEYKAELPAIFRKIENDLFLFKG